MSAAATSDEHDTAPRPIVSTTAPCTDGAVHEIDFGGQGCAVSCTGRTDEPGFEVCIDRDHQDGAALRNRLPEKGAEQQLAVFGRDTMDVRRIEAGILNDGADTDATLNPFQANPGLVTDMKKDAFVGRDTPMPCDRRPPVCDTDLAIARGIAVDIP